MKEKDILHDELTDTMVEEIEGTLLEDFIIDAMKSYHEQKTKELRDFLEKRSRTLQSIINETPMDTCYICKKDLVEEILTKLKEDE